MKFLFLLILFTPLVHDLAHADEVDDMVLERARYEKEHPRVYNTEVTLSADAYRSGLPGALGAGVRPVLSIDGFIRPGYSAMAEPAPWNVGGSFSAYTISNGVKIQRTDLTVHGGYWFFHRTLGLIAKLGTTDTSSDGFDHDTSTHFGAEIKYRIPLAERINLMFNVGWTRYGSANLDHDTGIPLTNDPVSNAFCSIFTFGLSNGCGDQIQTLNVPAANMVDVGVGLAILF
jgi:hypothetical protein